MTSANLNPIPPAHWSDLDPFLKASHLPPGKMIIATVDYIQFMTVHPRPGVEEIKPVMYFVGKQKGLILTKSNQAFLRENFGDEITASKGQRVTMAPVIKRVAGRDVDTILLGLPKEAPKP